VFQKPGHKFGRTFKFQAKTLPANPKILELNQIVPEMAIQRDPARFPFDLICDHQKPILAIFWHGTLVGFQNHTILQVRSRS
jgi:hypothetical protein